MFQIIPDGFDPIRIGMRRAEIDAALAEQPRTDHAAEREEQAFVYRDGCVRVVMRGDRAVELAISPPVQASFRGAPLFGHPATWRDIVAADGDAKEALGFIVLLRLRLTLTGFHDDDRAQLAITAFEPGRWDFMNERLTPFTV